MPDDRKIFTVLERSLITRGLGTARPKLVCPGSPSSHRRISPSESPLRGYTCTTRTDLWIRGGFCRGRSLMTRKERAVALGTRGGRDGSSSVRALVPFARLVGLMSVAVAVLVSARRLSIITGSQRIARCFQISFGFSLPPPELLLTLALRSFRERRIICELFVLNFPRCS